MAKTEEKVLWGKLSGDVAKVIQEKIRAGNITWHENSISFKSAGSNFTIKIEKDER